MNPNTNPPSGTRDFLASDLRKRRLVIKIIQEVYESFGFEPLETPAFENLSTLLGKYGEEGDQLLFRIMRRGEKLQEALVSLDLARQAAREGDPEQREAKNFDEYNQLRLKFIEKELNDFALRYDLTVPLARVMARYGSQLPRFYKRYQIQPVWRADRPAKGRFREFMQCDLDVCGSSSLTVETEVLAAACTVLEKLQFKDFSVLINHREVLRGLIDAAGIAAESEGTALVAVDKWDKVGKAGVAEELVRRGISSSSAGKLLELLEEANAVSDNAARLSYFRRSLNRASALKGLDDLQTILQLSEATGNAARISLAPNLARGLSYYTGAIFEIIVPGVSGSLGGGGRYDNLVGMFAARDIPACGFSLGLERILLLLEERGWFTETNVAIDILFMNFPENLAEILSLATRARRAGLICDVYPEAANLKAQFNYAAARKVRYVAFFGQREKENGQVLLKCQSDGTELNLLVANFVEELKQKGI
ncbi:MAG: histidine--tRNA ligase [bacterium]